MKKVILIISLIFAPIVFAEEHYYTLEENNEYGYLYEDNTIDMIRYLGEKKGVRQILLNNNISVEIIECKQFCKTIDVFTTTNFPEEIRKHSSGLVNKQKIFLGDDMVVTQMVTDALNNKLKVYPAKKGDVVWYQTDGLVYK